jgi:hypothetical protein
MLGWKILRKSSKLTAGTILVFVIIVGQPNQTPWLQSVNELYRLSDRRLSAKLVPTFADRVVSRQRRPYGHILGFLDRIIVGQEILICFIVGITVIITNDISLIV